MLDLCAGGKSIFLPTLNRTTIKTPIGTSLRYFYYFLSYTTGTLHNYDAIGYKLLQNRL